MKAILSLIVLFTSLSLMELTMANDPFSVDEPASQQVAPPTSTGSVFSISNEELPAVMSKASGGDSASSFRLYQYFKFSKSNLVESDKWLLKAAEHGHVTAQYNLAVSLQRKKDYSRALIWATAAKNNGVQGADDLIKEISENIDRSKDR